MILLIVPCYNEERRFDPSYWEWILSSLQSSSVSFIFVDDGSADNTFSILNKLNRFNNTEVISLKRNFGKANAIRMGLEYALDSKNELDLVGFIDSDSAFEKQEVVKQLVELTKVENPFDAIFFSRVKLSGSKIRRSELRHIVSRIIYTYIARGWNWAPYDTQCGFKLFKNSLFLHQAILVEFSTRWFFDIELSLRISNDMRTPLKIKELPLSFWNEREGSRIRAKHVLSILLEILRTRRLVKHHIQTTLSEGLTELL
jgi:glycosyltransferase involved in cell wall biosynthesis